MELRTALALVRDGHPRVEVKNLNSIRSMVDSIRYERARQAALLDEAQRVVDEMSSVR